MDHKRRPGKRLWRGVLLMLTNGLVSYLLAVPAVTVIVGSAIQPVPAPEDLSQYPLITYQTPSDVSEDGNDGPIGVSEARVVFDCFALRKLDAADRKSTR